MQGAALASFAFTGFQDMINVAEEVEEPERNFQKAILAALGESIAPLNQVVATATGDGRIQNLIPVIALFAVANTGLLNFIMASRLLYGMAGQGLLPGPLARVHAARRTPHWAILTVLAAALALALSGTLGYLAASTGTHLLVVFLTVNLALVMVKRRGAGRDEGGLRVPMAVPLSGVAITAAVTAFAEPSVLATTGGLVAAGAVLWGFRRLGS